MASQNENQAATAGAGSASSTAPETADDMVVDTFDSCSCLSTLPPDLFSEFLHFLPPADLTRASMLTSKSMSSQGQSGERAAFLAVMSMARLAVKWTKTANNTLAEEDSDAVEIRSLFSNHEIFGGEEEEQEQEDTAKIFRFQDETWQKLYRLLHDVLARLERQPSDRSDQNDSDDEDLEEEGEQEEAVPEEAGPNQVGNQIAGGGDGDTNEVDGNDTDESQSRDDRTTSYIALSVWLLFGSPILPPLTTQHRRYLESVARAFSFGLLPRLGETQLKTRCIQVALRLGRAGCWEVASSILHTAYNELLVMEAMGKVLNHPVSGQVMQLDANAVDIDILIYSCTFLIDRLYSQTYVRNDNEDTRALVKAVQFGRLAVKKAKQRYDAFYAKQQAADNAAEKGWTQKVDDEMRPAGNANSTDPPPPVTSLFLNEATRYMHALLAVSKALALLAQHIGLGATDIRSIGTVPINYTDEERRDVVNPPSEQHHFVETYRCSHYFIQEGIEQHTILSSIMTEQEPFFMEDEGSRICQSFVEVAPIAAAGIAAKGELFYCAASINSSAPIPVYELMDDPNPVRGCTKESVSLSAGGFDKIMKQVLYGVIEWNENIVDLCIRISKDLGKIYHFAQAMDLVADLDEPLEPGMYLDFAYLVACRQLGSNHPTCRNIKRLDRRPFLEIGSISDRYNRMMPWLMDNFGPRSFNEW